MTLSLNKQKALLTKKLYKAFEDAWVTTTELKVF